MGKTPMDLLKEFGMYGVMITPGLVVNGKVLSQGKIPVKSTPENWLKAQY